MISAKNKWGSHEYETLFPAVEAVVTQRRGRFIFLVAEKAFNQQIEQIFVSYSRKPV